MQQLKQAVENKAPDLLIMYVVSCREGAVRANGDTIAAPESAGGGVPNRGTKLPGRVPRRPKRVI